MRGAERLLPEYSLRAKWLTQVETVKSPRELLSAVKEIEADLGRVKTVDNGPRQVDLDILLYGNELLTMDDLTVPHPRMMEREFVLRPLCESVPVIRSKTN